MSKSPDSAARLRRGLQRKHMIGLVTLLGATALVGLMLASIAGWFHPKVPPQLGDVSRVGDRDDVPSEVVEAKYIRVPRHETAVGTIKPIHESVVAAKILARVISADLKAGQFISGGDVLVRLDDADLQARLKQAEAAVATATARKQQADADFSRAASLIASNAISKADYDQAVAAQKSLTSELQRAEQGLSEARVMLEYATITAPISGVIVDKKIATGDTVAPGQPLLTIYDPTHMQMVATVRESLATRLKVGATVDARIDSLGYECQATVSEIVPESQAASRSFDVKVTGPCPPGVLSGMFGRLLIPLDDEELLVVPQQAVRRIGQLAIVDVVGDDGAQRRSIQLGRTQNGNVEVLSGLRAGERVALMPLVDTKGN